MPILVLFTLFSLYVFYHMKKGLDKSAFQEYLEDDYNANFSRKKEIPPSLFVSPNIAALPIKSDLDEDAYKILIAKQNNVLKKSEKKMIRFNEPPSNKDLKKMFGVANLEVISTYEDNYRKYILALLSWAEALISNELFDDAILVLEESINFGSDFRKSYILLGAIYKERNDINSLQALYDNAINLDTASKDYILKNLNALLEEIKQ